MATEYILYSGDHLIGRDIDPGVYKIEHIGEEEDDFSYWVYSDIKKKSKLRYDQLVKSAYVELNAGNVINISADPNVKATLINYIKVDTEKLERIRIISEITAYLEKCSNDQLSNALILLTGLK